MWGQETTEAQKPQDCRTRPDVALEVSPQMMQDWMNERMNVSAKRGEQTADTSPQPNARVWSLLSLLGGLNQQPTAPIDLLTPDQQL